MSNKAMKQINNYIIEKLKISSKSVRTGNIHECTWETVDLPEYDWNKGKFNDNKIWKTLKLPHCAYVIYKDKYRGDNPHFGDIGDMITNMYYAQGNEYGYGDDYENFDPQKDILYASDDLKDALEWYFNYLGINKMPIKYHEDEWYDKYEDKTRKTCDDGYVLAEIYTGNDDCYDDMYIITNYKTQLKKCLSI